MSIKIKITNTGDTLELSRSNTSLLDVLRDRGIRIRSSCGGHATCSDCIVKVSSGDKNLSGVNFEEKKLLGNVYYITKERLACQVKCSETVSDEVSEMEIVNLDP